MFGYLIIIIICIFCFFDPGTQFQRKEKITLCNIKKYKNQAGMNLTPPPPIIIIIIIIIIYALDSTACTPFVTVNSLLWLLVCV